MQEQQACTTANKPAFKPMFLDETNHITKWVVCFSAAFFFFYEFVQMNMFNAISNSLMSDFNISGEMLSRMSSTYFYADVLFLFPAGILLDRVSTRKMILIALGICVISTYLFAGAHTFWFASLCHFASGIGNAFCFLSCMMLASRWFPPKQLALATGLIVTFAMAGGAIAQTPFELLSSAVGWRHAVLANAILGTVIFVVIWMFVADRPSIAALDYSKELIVAEKLAFFPSIRLAIANYQNWVCGIYTSFTNIPLMVFGGLWAKLYLQQVHHFSSTRAATISAMLFFGTIFGSPAFGAMSDRMGKRRFPMILGAFLSLLSVLFLLYSAQLDFVSALLLFYCIGFFTSSQVISYPTISESNRKAITGTSLGIASVLIMGGAGLAQQVFGWLLDLHWNHVVVNGVAQYTRSNYHTALKMFPIAMIIALFLAFLVKETYCTQQK